MKNCCKCLIGTTVLGAIAIGLGLYFGVITREDLEGLVDKAGDISDTIKDRFTDILDSDPFSGMGGISNDPNETSGIAWPTRGNKGGLELEIVNALDERWDAFFNKAVADWESGDPDALILSTSSIAADPSCSAIEGKMKVCNADYGDTGWRGVNELVWETGNRIVQSVAKMNEYYLTDVSPNDEKQYTMCHEIGHGFGLMHTDENFMNTPLGDCMDYSHVLGPNLLPGLINYQRLANMYGTVDGNGRRKKKLRHLRSMTIEEEKGMQSSKSFGVTPIRTRTAPAWVNENFHEKKKSLILGGDASSNEEASMNGWTVLHKSDLGEIHQVHLGGGYYGHVRALLV